MQGTNAAETGKKTGLSMQSSRSKTERRKEGHQSGEKAKKPFLGKEKKKSSATAATAERAAVPHQDAIRIQAIA